MKKAISALIAVMFVALTPLGLGACELVHLPKVRAKPPVLVPGEIELCWAGEPCPLKFQGERIPFLGRTIVEIGKDGESLQSIFTFEKNENTGDEYVMEFGRTTDRTCTDPYPVADDGTDINARIGAALPFLPCTDGKFYMKSLRPNKTVCQDQTLNCGKDGRVYNIILDSLDQIDDLHRGIEVTTASGLTISHSKNRKINFWYTDICCGSPFYYGAEGDRLSTDAYAVIRNNDGTCRVDKIREGARNSGFNIPVENPICE